MSKARARDGLPSAPPVERLDRVAGRDIERRIAIGDVLYLHDRVTGFSPKDCKRWCVVTAVVGHHVRVAGRSTTRQDGVSVPTSAMPEFDADGWVISPPVRISILEALEARNIGALDEHLVEQILFFTDEVSP